MFSFLWSILTWKQGQKLEKLSSINQVLGIFVRLLQNSRLLLEVAGSTKSDLQGRLAFWTSYCRQGIPGQVSVGLRLELYF